MTTGSQWHGKVITEFLPDGGPTQKCNVKTPPKSNLFNFDFKVGKTTYLILDGYGDELLPQEIVDRIFGEGTFKHGYALAINRSSGEVYTAHFGKDKTTNFMALHNLWAKVPKKYLNNLSELLSAKRPFCLRLEDIVWRDLWDHEMGFRDLGEEITVSLNFKALSLELWGERYREVPYWTRD